MEIKLKGTKYNGFRAQFDEEDYELIKNYKWRTYKTQTKCRDTYYAIADAYITKTNEYYPNGNGKRNKNDTKTTISMHRLLMEFPKHPNLVDHINRNGLDNKKENLRVTTKRENRLNSQDIIKNGGISRVIKDKRKISCYIDNDLFAVFHDLAEKDNIFVSDILRDSLIFYLESKHPKLLN